MKSHRKELWFNVPGRSAFMNITPQVDECLRGSGIKEGLCLVNAMQCAVLPHITASVFINDAAGPEAAGPRTGGTTVPERTPVQDGQDRRRAPEAERYSQGCA